jgi:hypothetical protein
LRTITVAERRARLGVRHHLAGRAGTVEQVAGDLAGLHSTDPVTVFLGARARTAGVQPEDLEAALYERRSLARMLAMRRTMFVVPTDLVPLLHAAATRALVARQRSRIEKLLADGGVSDRPDRWLWDVQAATMAALEARGQATAVELGEDVPELRIKIATGAGKVYEGTIGVSTQVLFLLATEGRIIRGRPRGSWISTQYRWAPMASWAGVEVDAMDTPAAQAELARRWLRAFGPGTAADLKWWTGWTVRDTKRALAAVGAAEVDLDGAVGYVLAEDLDPVGAPEPWVALLPALDSTVMGWKERAFYLGGHAPALFDRNGNAGPTVWADGRVVGGWAQRKDGEIALRPLDDVGAATEAAVAAEADAVRDWLGDVRFTPRFRTPLERELTA